MVGERGGNIFPPSKKFSEDSILEISGANFGGILQKIPETSFQISDFFFCRKICSAERRR